ncbi:MAG TPA: hypothetical protein VK837_06730 [Longimicrobiales bacterium]|nr:hypothetical protein [Longimicrobiales bacterium]
MTPRGAPFGAVATLAVAAVVYAADPCLAQTPVLQVRLGAVGEVLVEGRLTSNGVLQLPVDPLEELTGKELGDTEFLSMDELARALGPQVEVVYDPRRALLTLADPFGTLPASRARMEQGTASARATPGLVYGRGLFSTLTADEDGESSVEAGWNFGRVAFNLARSSRTGDRLGLAVQPFRSTWLSLEAREASDTRLGARWATGRSFVRTSYSMDEAMLRGQVGTGVGPWTFYVQREPDDWGAAVTYTGPATVTLARAHEQLRARVSFGRTTSPFSIPGVR